MFCVFPVQRPALASYRYDAGGCFQCCPLRSGDLAHRAVEVHSQNLNKEVDGIASQVALGPAPIAFLDDEAGKGGQLEIARLLFDELQSALLQQGNEWDLPGRADLAKAVLKVKSVGRAIPGATPRLPRSRR